MTFVLRRMRDVFRPKAIKVSPFDGVTIAKTIHSVTTEIVTSTYDQEDEFLTRGRRSTYVVLTAMFAHRWFRSSATRAWRSLPPHRH